MKINGCCNLTCQILDKLFVDAEALLEILYEISEKDVPANVIHVDFAHSAEVG